MVPLKNISHKKIIVNSITELQLKFVNDAGYISPIQLQHRYLAHIIASLCILPRVGEQNTWFILGRIVNRQFYRIVT